MQLLFATSNPHKIEEVAAILAPQGMEVIGLDALDVRPDEPVEDGETFQANARIKAIGYAQATGRPCLADDSGLEVDALRGAPGVVSARYAGSGETRAEQTAANNARLLRELVGVPPDRRAARFVCAMCLADQEGAILAESRGTLEGVIADEPRGTSGFGYDPLVYLPELGHTVAELSADEKNARSHRGEAARRMADLIADLQLA
ncbi:MAG: RdgB/HAM1 family non-canonical purine NTP pyrophosphatase [Planctomycetota bacterium]|nr:RdgB/HAM1 family non-canonical purine NTP pyrophosphatase [Planctomycetota bacterium]